VGEDIDRVHHLAVIGAELIASTYAGQPWGLVSVHILGGDGHHAWVTPDPGITNEAHEIKVSKPIAALAETLHARFISLVSPVLLGNVDEHGQRIEAAEDPEALVGGVSWAGSSTGDEAMYLSLFSTLDDGTVEISGPEQVEHLPPSTMIRFLRDALTAEPMNGGDLLRWSLAKLHAYGMRRNGYTVMLVR